VSVDGATWNLHRAIPGALAVAEYDTGAGEPITLVCLYGLMENRWVYPTLLRLLADLSPLLYSRRRRPLILGGDFNAGATKMAVWARIYQPVWDTLAALGLVDLTRHTAHTRPPSVDCPCVASPDCGHLPTQRPRTGAQGLQVDQLWCTAPMLERLDRLEVRDAGDAPFGLSDHRPLIATFRDN
jgi:endonuclease/exonuclease/phosphatase (EEP) superfamily protein YafD